jgi:hypothetical protein
MSESNSPLRYLFFGSMLSLGILSSVVLTLALMGYNFRPIMEATLLHLQGKPLTCENFSPAVADLIQKCVDSEIRD